MMTKFYKVISRYLYLLVVMFVFLYLPIVKSENMNVNTLTIVPSTYSGRYFCPIDLSVTANYNGGSGFGNCQYGLNFDSANVDIIQIRTGLDFPKLNLNLLTGQNNNILYVDVSNPEEILTGTSVCSVIRIQTTSSNISYGLFKFVDLYGNTPDSNTFSNTPYGGVTLAYNGENTLTGVQDLIVNFEACPCTLDSEAPIVAGRSHNSNAHYVGPQTIRFLIYDDGGTPRSYWTSGSKNLDNYAGGAPEGMDNQEGVDSGTIVVYIYSGDVLVNTLTHDSGLTITTYTGDTGIPRYTWDGNDRGYWVSFEVPDLQVEAPVTIVVSGADNALNGGGDCITQRHFVRAEKSLNQAQAPIIKFVSPQGENINPDVGVTLTVSDSRAGVDTGSLVVEILPVMSGGDVIMTGSIYSGSDLNFQLIEGSDGLGGASKYRVTFQPIYEFAVDSTITLSGYVQDLIGIPAHREYSFHTRKDCTFYGCVNFVDIFSGNWENINLIQGNFTGSLIVITGTILPYPLLTGENSEIVMCAPIDASINLTGNVDIYSGDEKINGNKYMYEDLYVTGLDFEYQDGVIIPRY